MNNVHSKILLSLFLSISVHTFGQQNTISDSEVKDLLYMLEEEKVAHDVYELLYETWHLRVFNTIKQSEQRHMDMIENLLNTNKIPYKLNNSKGAFYNEDLQKMYNDLIKKGTQSKQNALEVGKLIEETDINDLEEAIKNTNDASIKQVYTNLVQASKNHLQAFKRQLLKY
jgi:hypothetical protein